jgi:hypothetical protein
MYLRHVKIRILEVSKTTPRTLATNKFWTLVLFIQSVQKCGIDQLNFDCCVNFENVNGRFTEKTFKKV